MTDMTLNERIATAKGWEELAAIEGSYKIPGGYAYRLPDWSGSIADAWGLVEEIGSAGRRDMYPVIWQDKGTDLWVCEFGKIQSPQWCDTAPEAICLAYLAVKGGK